MTAVLLRRRYSCGHALLGRKPKRRPTPTKVLFLSTEDANLNVGRVLVRMSRGGQAVPYQS